MFNLIKNKEVDIHLAVAERAVRRSGDLYQFLILQHLSDDRAYISEFVDVGSELLTSMALHEEVLASVGHREPPVEFFF